MMGRKNLTDGCHPYCVLCRPMDEAFDHESGLSYAVDLLYDPSMKLQCPCLRTHKAHSDLVDAAYGRCRAFSRSVPRSFLVV